MRILLAGATGSIGRAVAHQLISLGHEVLCPLRPGSTLEFQALVPLRCDLTEAGSLTRALGEQRIDAVISCMATRTGATADAWAVEHDAQVNLLNESKLAGAQHFVLLSAICVQRPHLAFQKAKAKFEERLMASGTNWSIVRPTAFFKSLSGQVARVKAGKPFLLFGDGALTACKPISDRDLATYIVRCLTDDKLKNAILPIGGPGPAITPRAQAERLFELLNQEPRLRHVPVVLMDVIVGALSFFGLFSSALRDKAEFARTGRYYATQSMLVWDAKTGRYDANATPEFGSDTLWDHYADLVAGRSETDLGAHAFYSDRRQSTDNQA